MKKLFVVVLSGTMASGKTTLAKGIEESFKQIPSDCELHTIKEKNFYLKGEYLSELKIQQNLLENFCQRYREIVLKIQKSNTKVNVILLDTFPILIGEIFTRLKIKHGLIDVNKELYNTFNVMVGKCVADFKEVNDELLLDSGFAEVNVINLFRVAEKDVQWSHMEARSMKEFVFYKERLDYFNELCWELENCLNRTIDTLLVHYPNEYCIHDSIKQKIGLTTDMDLLNQNTLEIILDKVFSPKL